MQKNWRKWLVVPLWVVWALILISTVNPRSAFGLVVILAGLFGGFYALCLWAKVPMDKD